jgi:allantoinase
VSIIKEEDWHGNLKKGQIIDYGEAVVMPGLIDV